MSTPLIHLSTDFAANPTVEMIGGKVLNLMRIVDAGWRVPAFYVITYDAFRRTVFEDLDFDRDQDVQQAAARIREHIERATLDPDLVQAIHTAHASCLTEQTWVAVRSSSGSEDGLNHSFAGIHDSVLGVQGIPAILNAVKQVWLSAVGERALAYRKAHGLPLIDTRMAVIVQRLVDVGRSGVCFTCDPVSGDANEIVISSLPGVGEGLVSRGFPADTYRVNRETFHVVSEVVVKPEQLVLNRESGGLRSIDIEPSDRVQSSLSTEEVVQVAKLAIELESRFGEPQDIEFGFAEERIHSDECAAADESGCLIFQSRPVTRRTNPEDPNPALSNPALSNPALSNPALSIPLSNSEGSDHDRSSLGNHIVWDNSNIIESYCGVTTPMTFSFIRRAYSIVYHCFSEVMGISPKVVQEHHDAFDNMLGLFHGRVYYNLKNWYRLVRMFPGYHYNRRFMESMMGVKESLLLEDEQPPVGVLRKWFVEFPSLLKLVSRSGWNFLRIRSTVDRFQRHFDRHYREWCRSISTAFRPTRSCGCMT